MPTHREMKLRDKERKRAEFQLFNLTYWCKFCKVTWRHHGMHRFEELDCQKCGYLVKPLHSDKIHG